MVVSAALSAIAVEMNESIDDYCCWRKKRERGRIRLASRYHHASRIYISSLETIVISGKLAVAGRGELNRRIEMQRMGCIDFFVFEAG